MFCPSTARANWAELWESANKRAESEICNQLHHCGCVRVCYVTRSIIKIHVASSPRCAAVSHVVVYVARDIREFFPLTFEWKFSSFSRFRWVSAMKRWWWFLASRWCMIKTPRLTETRQPRARVGLFTLAGGKSLGKNAYESSVGGCRRWLWWFGTGSCALAVRAFSFNQ
jgi:hypothetical protein